MPHVADPAVPPPPADAPSSGPDTILTVRGLCRRFGKLEVLRGLDCSVPRGAVYGLLGLNGSGKTTTLKCVLGLLAPQAGTVSVLDVSPRHLHRTRGRVGVAFDAPSLPVNLSVRQCLEHARLVCGSRSRPASEVEALLGLAPAHRVKIRKLSRGNQQRASIAHALVGRPDLVILDEPFSGLDAGGVDDLRDLIRRLHREENTTFVVASHQLAYIESACTHVGILSGGRLALEGRLRDVLGGRPATIRVRTENPERAAQLLRDHEGVRAVEMGDDGRLRVETRSGEAARLNRALVTAGFAVDELVARPPSLASVFRDIVERGT